jgi:O-antigen chain-terminating methyltransferase
MMLVERRLSELLQKTRPAPMAGEDEHNHPSTPLLSDVLYCEFEDHFRGTEDEIKSRVEFYIPRMHDLHVGSPEMPIVDIGCGRGEWLDALREQQLLAYGVDANSVAIEKCREKGLTVEERDGIEHLQSLPSSSVGAVTAFHFVEHLPLHVLLRFIDEILRVLKPGGVVLLETPNPDNLIVGSSSFYLDPTHYRPLPSGLLRFLLQSRGFDSVEIIPLHPYPASHRVDETDNQAARVVNERLFGCQDYGVLAVRP